MLWAGSVEIIKTDSRTLDSRTERLQLQLMKKRLSKNHKNMETTKIILIIVLIKWPNYRIMIMSA